MDQVICLSLKRQISVDREWEIDISLLCASSISRFIFFVFVILDLPVFLSCLSPAIESVLLGDCDIHMVFCSVQGPAGQHHHFCEKRTGEDTKGSKLRSLRILAMSRGLCGYFGRWGWRAEEEHQRGICEDHTALLKENEAGEAGSQSKDQ